MQRSNKEDKFFRIALRTSSQVIKTPNRMNRTSPNSLDKALGQAILACLRERSLPLAQASCQDLVWVWLGEALGRLREGKVCFSSMIWA